MVKGYLMKRTLDGKGTGLHFLTNRNIDIFQKTI